MCIFIFSTKNKQQTHNSDDAHHFSRTINKIPGLFPNLINFLTFQVSGNSDRGSSLAEVNSPIKEKTKTVPTTRWQHCPQECKDQQSLMSALAQFSTTFVKQEL